MYEKLIHTFGILGMVEGCLFLHIISNNYARLDYMGTGIRERYKFKANNDLVLFASNYEKIQ